MKKLTTEEIEKRKAYHKKRLSFYSSKLKKLSEMENRIGFKRYD